MGVPGRVIGASGALTGQQQIKVKTVKPPPKVQIPQEEEREEDTPRAGGGDVGGRPGPVGLDGASRVSSPLVSASPPTSAHSEEATDTR